MKPELSDEEIVRKIKQKEVNELQKFSLFELVVNKYKNKVFLLVYNYIKPTGTLHDAEEIVLETFTKFWFSIEKFKFNSTVYTYIYRIATNLAINFLKSKKRQKESVSIDEIVPELVENDLETVIEFESETEQIQSIVNSAIDHLPPNQKMALILAKFEHKSYQEIAEIMNTSVSSVESLLFRARQNLKKFLTKKFLKK